MTLENIPDIDWARLAAYIDGEGCISLNRTKRKDGRCFSYRPAIDIGNTNFILMDWLRFMFNFKIYTRKAGLGHLGSKINYYAYMSKKDDVIYVLNHILPYLLIKTEQATLLLLFWLDKEVLWIKGAKVPEYIEEKRYQLYLKIRSLNS